MNKRLLIIMAMGIVFFIIAYSLSSNNEAAYIEKISKVHEDQINFLCLSPESPVKDVISRDDIHYFEPSITYKVKAKIVEIPNPGRVELVTNDGTKRPYIKFALAVFEINGETDSLTLFIEPTFNANYKKAFIPFSDLSSGISTYGAGRYLDAEIKDDSYIELDFNLAYNPYCVYTDEFVCPLPPAENSLRFEILAGEKNYESLH